MPCRDAGAAEESQAADKRKIDNLTRMLCAAQHMLDETQRAKIDGLPEWWAQHQEADMKRIAWERYMARERAKEKYLQEMAKQFEESNPIGPVPV